MAPAWHSIVLSLSLSPLSHSLSPAPSTAKGKPLKRKQPHTQRYHPNVPISVYPYLPPPSSLYHIHSLSLHHHSHSFRIFPRENMTDRPPSPSSPSPSALKESIERLREVSISATYPSDVLSELKVLKETFERERTHPLSPSSSPTSALSLFPSLLDTLLHSVCFHWASCLSEQDLSLYVYSYFHGNLCLSPSLSIVSLSSSLSRLGEGGSMHSSAGLLHLTCDLIEKGWVVDVDVEGDVSEKRDENDRRRDKEQESKREREKEKRKEKKKKRERDRGHMWKLLLVDMSNLEVNSPLWSSVIDSIASLPDRASNAFALSRSKPLSLSHIPFYSSVCLSLFRSIISLSLSPSSTQTLSLSSLSQSFLPQILAKICRLGHTNLVASYFVDSVVASVEERERERDTGRERERERERKGGVCKERSTTQVNSLLSHLSLLLSSMEPFASSRLHISLLSSLSLRRDITFQQGVSLFLSLVAPSLRSPDLSLSQTTLLLHTLPTEPKLPMRALDILLHSIGQIEMEERERERRREREIERESVNTSSLSLSFSHILSVWSSPQFVKHAPLPTQEYCTRSLLLSLSLIRTKAVDPQSFLSGSSGSHHLSSLLSAVQMRLNNTNVRAQQHGKDVAETMSLLLSPDEPLSFGTSPATAMLSREYSLYLEEGTPLAKESDEEREKRRERENGNEKEREKLEQQTNSLSVNTSESQCPSLSPSSTSLQPTTTSLLPSPQPSPSSRTSLLTAAIRRQRIHIQEVKVEEEERESKQGQQEEEGEEWDSDDPEQAFIMKRFGRERDRRDEEEDEEEEEEEEEEEGESETDSDSDLSAFEFEDVPAEKDSNKIRRPVFIRQVLEYLLKNIEKEAQYIESALDSCVDIIRKTPMDTDLPFVASELTRTLVSLGNNLHLVGETDRYEAKRRLSLASLVAVMPQKSVPVLTSMFYGENFTIQQRLSILDVLHEGAWELGAPPRPVEKEKEKERAEEEEEEEGESEKQKKKESEEEKEANRLSEAEEKIRARVESNTRRWGYATRPSSLSQTTFFNRLGDEHGIGQAMFFGLIRGAQRDAERRRRESGSILRLDLNTNPNDNLFEIDSVLLERLVNVLGVVLYCCGPTHMLTSEMCMEFYNFTTELRDHPQVNVRRHVLRAFARILSSLSSFLVMITFSSVMEPFIQWLRHTRNEDSDLECRRMSVVCMRILKKHLEEQEREMESGNGGFMAPSSSSSSSMGDGSNFLPSSVGADLKLSELRHLK